MPEAQKPPVDATVKSPPGESFSLRIKVIIALAGLGLLPLIFITVHSIFTYSSLLSDLLRSVPDSTFAESIAQRGRDAARSIIQFAVIYSVLVFVGVYFADRIFIGPIRAMIAWLRDAQGKKFINVEPLSFPVTDELGLLAYEMDRAIKYFHEVEEREHQITEEKGEFISVAAHQLRTPLTGLKWAFEVLRDPAKTPQERAALVDQAAGTADRMVQLVDDVLDVAKMEEGKFGYEYAQADIIGPLQKLVDDSAVVADSRQVRLRFDAHPASLSVYVDVARVILAVSNLISNALDYTLAGGEVVLELKPLGKQVRIAVRDTGIGIPREELTHLFNKFYRGSSARHMRPSGSGLGLYIARNIALRHGSDIAVLSEEGKGSTFSFTVPVDQLDMGKTDVTVGKFFASF